jgi:hypothetical protein
MPPVNVHQTGIRDLTPHIMGLASEFKPSVWRYLNPLSTLGCR